MSEMSQAQQPAGGDADPDPSADIVPPAASPDPEIEVPDVEEVPADLPDSGSDVPPPAPAEPTGPADDGATAGSDPMTDVAGTEPA